MIFQEKLFTLVQQHLSDKAKKGEIKTGFISNTIFYTARYTEALQGHRLTRCEVQYECFSNGLLIRAVCPYKADAEKYRAVLEKLNCWNCDEVSTVFEFDCTDGTISTRTFLRFSTLDEFSTELIKRFSFPIVTLLEHENELLQLLEN